MESREVAQLCSNLGRHEKAIFLHEFCVLRLGAKAASSEKQAREPTKFNNNQADFPVKFEDKFNGLASERQG